MSLDVYFLLFVIASTMLGLTLAALVQSVPLNVLAQAESNGRYTWLGAAEQNPSSTPRAGLRVCALDLEVPSRLTA